MKRVIVLSIALTGFCERPTPAATSDHNSYDLARIKTARRRARGRLSGEMSALGHKQTCAVQK
ncbi:MAG: hypothetical protein WB803_08720, partial [Pseudolabrys sp.]